MPNYWDKLSDFKFPVLIICGNEDKKYCEIGNKLNTKIINSKIQIIKSTGHAPQIDQSVKLINLIQNFIKI